MNTETLIEKDLSHVWHPCSQMKDYETFKPLVIDKAQGSYIHTHDGRKIIDAISSWWCKSLGHNHPRLKQAILRQLDKFEHVILANTTNEIITQLSEKLASLTQNLSKVFYAGDGSCAVEIAMKMSLHANQLLGNPSRNRFIALSNGYHGETIATLSVSDLGLYKKPYEPLCFDCYFVDDIPYVLGKDDPLWNDCSDYWPGIEKQLEPFINTATALIVEPIVQGAGGMLIYSQDFLKRLRQWCSANNVHLIADEIMTGIGRTGLPLACKHAGIEADFVCISKGLTSGWLPFSCVLTSNTIYNLFYDDYETGRSFLHSHTYTGNALAASVALETLQVMENQNIYSTVIANEKLLLDLMKSVAHTTGKLTNIRHIGAIVAADITTELPRVGYAIFQEAVKLGALLRPLGNTLYWSAPLNTSEKTLYELANITTQAITNTLS
jgi:adenosylmethionine-8-amino-7-oxononanoate aminotransferase